MVDDKVPPPLIPNGIKDKGIPEKIYYCGECRAVTANEKFRGDHYFSCSKGWLDNKPEYVLKSVADKKLQPIREVYEKHKNDKGLLEILRCTHTDIWQAIEKTIKEDEEKAPN